MAENAPELSPKTRFKIDITLTLLSNVENDPKELKTRNTRDKNAQARNQVK